MSEQPGGKIILNKRSDTSAIDVRLDGDTVWLSLAQLVDLFDSNKANISEHIRKIYAEGELSKEATVRKFRTVQNGGGRQVGRYIEHYNLDMIISLGYRLKSSIATQFRIWATERLREYLVKGFTLDELRMENQGGDGYWKELLDRIRDIRSSEKLLYKQILDLYETSVDYDSKSETSITFFRIVQNELHYVPYGQDEKDVVIERLLSGKPVMGMFWFSNNRSIFGTPKAKNFIAASKMKLFNPLISGYFDAAEFRAIYHVPTSMKDWLAQLEQLIAAMSGKCQQGVGKVSREQTIGKAEEDYEKYRAQMYEQSSDVETANQETVNAAQKEICGENKP